jgi:integrase
MTEQSIIPVEQITTIGLAANHAARSHILADYQDRQAMQTLRRQRADLALFAHFLQVASNQDVSQTNRLDVDLASWSEITWGLVEAFKRWQLQEGYATGSINVRLSTIKVYSELAFKSGHLDEQAYILIRTVSGYRAKQARNIDAKREQTRRDDAKKAAPVSISPVHATLLMSQPDSRRGRRDQLLMCLLLEHGLRVSEVADLDITNINLETGQLLFYRTKVDKDQEHTLTPNTWRAAAAYLQDCRPGQSALFEGTCSKNRVNERSLNDRVTVLGAAIGLVGLSPHDCRHFWATDAIRNGTDIKSLQDAGGWSSPAMPLRYAEANKIANKDVKLSTTK